MKESLAKNFLRNFVSPLRFPQVQAELWKKRAIFGWLSFLFGESSAAHRTRISSYSWWQLARFLGPAGTLSRNCPFSGSGAERKAILLPPAPALRNSLPGSVPRNGGLGVADWSRQATRKPPPVIFGSFHHWKEQQKEDSAAPAAGSFAHGGKGTKTPFFRPLWQEVPSGGQNLSGLRPSFRATGPWRGKGWGFLISLGPPDFCHAVCFACFGPAPTAWQPARFLGPAGTLSRNCPFSGSGGERKAILLPPAPALRNDLPGSVPRNGGPGESRHGGPGGWPPVRLRRPPAILWFLSDRSERNTPVTLS